MKSIMVSAIAISAAALASCGANGGGGGTAQITFYGSSINESASGFDLYETVMNSGNPVTVPPCSPPLPPSGSNPFLSGIVDCGGTNTGQIAYVVNVLGVDGSSHSVTLNLTGNDFLIPAASLAAGNVTGTQGTVQAINEAIDGQTVFQVEGLDVDATAMTDAIAGGDYREFWSLVAHGGGRSLNGAYNGSGTFSVYCGANNTGASINLTSAATPMGKFLDGC